MTDAAKKARDEARKIAKQTGEEFGEIAKQAKKEVSSEKPKDKTSPVVEAMKQQSGSGTSDDSKVKTSGQSETIKRLEKELEELRLKRKKEEKKWKKEQDEKMKENDEPSPPQPQAVSKPKMGPPTPGKKKPKGSGELVKSKK